MLELNEDDGVSTEHLDSQVQKAQEQLLQLKRQQEQIEKQKRELEELSRRQEELERGRAEMTDRLTRSLVVLEREAYEAQTKMEQLRATPRKFCPTSRAPGSDRSEDVEPVGLKQGAEPRLQHGGRCADRIQPAAQPAQATR